jgi:hypothetical protein
MQRQDLERMSREQLVGHAERLGIPRPRVLTAPELIDEIIGRTAKDERERTRARGWLGRARDLLANVVEKGLHLPEAARALRQEEKSWPAPPPPLPTVTLAEIYAAQGHFERAITVLDEVLGREPDHREARSLRERFVDQLQRSRSRKVDVPPAPPAPVRAPKHGKDMSEKKIQAPPASQDEALASTEKAPVLTAAGVAPEQAEAEPGESAAGASAALDTDEAATPAEDDDAEAAETATADDAEDAEAGADHAEAGADDAEADEEAALAAAAAEAAPAAEDEPPLPQRYEVDEVVAIAVDPRTIYIYWEVRPTTLARARAEQPDGVLTVRIASVTASWEGPVVDTRDLHVDALYGDRFIRDVQPGSNVRVSVGWKGAAGFEPLAVGAEVTAPRAVPVDSVAQEVARWEEEPPAPFSAWRPDDAPPVVHAPPPGVHVARAEGPIPWMHATAAHGPAGHGAPVDTGVALWGEVMAEASAPGTPPREEIRDLEVVEAESWFIAGGASELSRGGPARVRTVRVHRLIPGVPGAHAALGHLRGGASELSRGGASELSRG